MRLDEAMEDNTMVSYGEAQAEPKRYNYYMTESEFHMAFGVSDEYKASEILFFLGY
jgi:hypothetical protein